MTSFKKTATIFVTAVTALTLSGGICLAEEKPGLANLTEMAEKAATMAESGSLGELININSATPEMLANIPGVGEKIGQAIAQYREAHGAFTQIKDLLKVEGIDASLLETIEPFLQL